MNRLSALVGGSLLVTASIFLQVAADVERCRAFLFLQARPETRPEILQKLSQLLPRMSETDRTSLHWDPIIPRGWLANKLDRLDRNPERAKDDVRGGSSQNQKLNLNVRKKRGRRSAALRAEKFPSALSPWFCRGWCAPFIFLCLLGFPGPNHLRIARPVHGNLPLSFSVPLLRRSAHCGRMDGNCRSPKLRPNSKSTRYGDNQSRPAT